MVTTVNTYFNTATAQGDDGVVRVVSNGYYGTGTLLEGGKAILTAAHIFQNTTNPTNIQFQTTAGTQTLTATQIVLHPDADITNGNNDIAIVWLSQSAPTQAERYALYRNTDEIGQTFTLVGYGKYGLGSATTENTQHLRLKAQNQFDADVSTLKNAAGHNMSWSPLAGTQLLADFDDGTATHDALGQLINVFNTGLGDNEGLIAPGDSGGPAFINHQIAGIASYTTAFSINGNSLDTDNTLNSSFGEIAAWQRVSAYQQWIDQTLRAHYPDAPTKAADVKKEITETHSGTTYAYFFLEFSGIRTNPNEWLSVDYTTRDGTATASTDYIATSGTLILYPNENQAVIPVEIIGDTTPEPDETFYLDITHPVGGSFGNGVLQLTAIRTIVNDDF